MLTVNVQELHSLKEHHRVQKKALKSNVNTMQSAAASIAQRMCTAHTSESPGPLEALHNTGTHRSHLPRCDRGACICSRLELFIAMVSKPTAPLLCVGCRIRRRSSASQGGRGGVQAGPEDGEQKSLCMAAVVSHDLTRTRCTERSCTGRQHVQVYILTYPPSRLQTPAVSEPCSCGSSLWLMSLSCVGGSCSCVFVQMRRQQSQEEDIQKLLADSLGDKAKSREDLVRMQPLKGPQEFRR